MEGINKVNLLKNKKVAILGGGPGGLTLARLLQLKGAEVKVYERDFSKESRVQGAIVDLHFDSGLKVMAAAGLLDSFKDVYMRGADKYRMVDKNANIYIDEDNKDGDDFTNENFRPEIDRGVLRNLLIDNLLLDTVIWDSHFVSMDQINDSWELKFQNGSIAFADIVIGSDGHLSKVRPYVTDIQSLYSGATIIQGEIENPETECPDIYNLVDNANLIAMDIGKTIAAQPMASGGLTFYAASLYPENWAETSGINFKDPNEVYAYLVQYYEGWNPIFFTLFKACKKFVIRPLNYFPLDQDWEAKSNVTLIGDAAHLMPPSGEGVNTAMLDAFDLSECLCNEEFPDLKVAISEYESRMKSRAAVLGKEAIDGIKDFASPSAESIKELVELFKSE
ncbi:2-polyprenyl-6-methoxyphenol hydroxylase-like FAD-dependent oxidoreductase [Flavobacterium sp. 2755]|uniref:FAD-dependent oxidoreductase n=1 Tax=Flavobacterium sp. 2755 TaxID=2817765 RepID=UPI00285E1766|nr:FAD-dependent monooxygenase [Flavobacterium sp. 2755]MDR6760039.1 2-polyprenyl-6-methoxyphenol hydroxylase-like FAD-dependent oxidoreductase [Flavobacterium sp. 2755]